MAFNVGKLNNIAAQAATANLPKFGSNKTDRPGNSSNAFASALINKKDDEGDVFVRNNQGNNAQQQDDQPSYASLFLSV